MKNRILKLEEIIPRLKVSKKILPLKVECLEWELRALKAEAKLNNLLKPDVSGRSEQLCEVCGRNIVKISVDGCCSERCFNAKNKRN